MKPLIVIQCRLNSTRLPGKAALDMCGRSLLTRVIGRCKQVQSVSGVVVATSIESQDDIVESMARSAGADVFRGSLNNVRKRFIDCANRFGADVILRVTADNPFVEPALIHRLIDAKKTEPNCAYAVHDLNKTVYGIATELVDVSCLVELQPMLPKRGREHVTTGLADLESAKTLMPPAEFSDPSLALTIDTFHQYQVAWRVLQRFGDGPQAVPEIVEAYRSGNAPDIDFQVRP